MLKSLAADARRQQRNSLTRARFGFCVVQSAFTESGSSPVAFARTDNSGRPIPRRHPLTLIVRLRSPGLRLPSVVVTGCVCLHALSSFQRTDRGAPGALHPAACFHPTTPDLPEGPRRLTVAARLGEPIEVTGTTHGCQPHGYCRPGTGRGAGRRTLELRVHISRTRSQGEPASVVKSAGPDDSASGLSVTRTIGRRLPDRE